MVRDISQHVGWLTTPSIAKFSPARILVALERIRIDLAPQPEIEPVEIAGVDSEPVGGLQFGMIFLGEDIERYGFSGILQRGDAVDRAEKFLVGQLHEERRVDRLGVERERNRPPEGFAHSRRIGITLEATIVCQSLTAIDHHRLRIDAAGADRRRGKQLGVDQGKLRGCRTITEPGKTDLIRIDDSETFDRPDTLDQCREDAAPVAPALHILDLGIPEIAPAAGWEGLVKGRRLLNAEHGIAMRGE